MVSHFLSTRRATGMGPNPEEAHLVLTGVPCSPCRGNGSPPTPSSAHCPRCTWLQLILKTEKLVSRLAPSVRAHATACSDTAPQLCYIRWEERGRLVVLGASS